MTKLIYRMDQVDGHGLPGGPYEVPAVHAEPGCPWPRPFALRRGDTPETITRGAEVPVVDWPDRTDHDGTRRVRGCPECQDITEGRRQSREARVILSTCTADTPRPVVAWAAGVVTAHHARAFVLMSQPGGRLMASHDHGGTLDGARFYWANRSGFTVERCGVPVVSVTSAQVAALVRPDVVARLRARIDAAMAARREHGQLEDRARREVQAAGQHYAVSEVGRAVYRAGQVIEDECEAIAASVWESCRPADDALATQMDLFSLV